MPVTIKTSQLAVKNPATGEYDGLNIVGDTTTKEMINKLTATAERLTNELPDISRYVSVDTQTWLNTEKAQARQNIDALSGNEAIRYDIVQNLNNNAKMQARENIGAAGAGEVDDLKSALQPGKMYASREAFIADVPTGKYGDLPVNRVYAVGVYAVDAEDEPCENFLGTIMTLSSQAMLRPGDVQIAISNNGELYYRYYTVGQSENFWREWQQTAKTTEVEKALFPGKMYASRKGFLNDVPSGKYGNLPVNRVYAVGLYAMDAEDEPCEDFLGTIMTLSSQGTLMPGDVQIAISNSVDLYYRYYTTSVGGNFWQGWKKAATPAEITTAVTQMISSRFADLTIVENNAGLRSSTSAFVLVKHNDSAWGDNGPCLFAETDAEYGSYVRNNGTYIVPLANQGNLPAPNANFADMLAVMKTYVGKSDLIYGNDHHMYAETCTNEIDCSTFVTAVMNGIPYQKSRYVADSNTLGESVGDTLLQYSDTLGWTKLDTYNMASWFAQHKRLFEIPKSTAKPLQMLRFGDLLFGTTSAEDVDSRYYGIGHVGIVLGTIPRTRTVIVAEAGEFANTTINGNESTVCKTACLEFSLANIQQYFKVFARPDYGATKVGDEGALPQFATDGKYHLTPRFTINAFVSTSTGALSSSNTWAATEAFYEVIPGKTITYTGATKDENNVPYGCACIEYDADRNFIKVTTLTETACVLSNNTKYVRFNFGHYGSQNAKMTLARIDDFSAALEGEVSDLKSALDDMQDEIDNFEGISDDVKTALLACFANVTWINDQGQSYYNALESALNHH